MQSMIKPRHDKTHGRGKRRPVGPGPPPGCSAPALVSTWLCPLSASQRAAEWGSIETNSLCRTQLMGLPGLGGRGGGCRSVVTDPGAQACWEFATWNLSSDNNKPTAFQSHLLLSDVSEPVPEPSILTKCKNCIEQNRILPAGLFRSFSAPAATPLEYYL